MNDFHRQLIELSDYQGSHGKNSRTDVSMEKNCTGWKLSIQTLTEGINPISMETFDFEQQK